MIKVQGLNYIIGEKQILHDINFQIEKGIPN